MSETVERPRRAPAALAKNALLLVVVTTLCLCVAEGVLRLALPAAESGWASVPPLEERVTAVEPKADGEYRVLALGDSFTEYADERGVNWARVVERAARADGRELTLFNFGQMGTGLAHYKKNLEDFGAEVQPDLVVIGLYLGNDVLDYELALEKEARGLAVSPPKTLGRRPSGLVPWLKQHSVLAGLLARAASAVRPGPTTFERNLAHAGEIYGLAAEELARRVAAHDSAVVEMANREVINPWDLAFGLVTPSRYADLLALKGTSRVPAALERLLADVEATEATCERLKATCAWVLLPVGLQIDERYHAYFRDVGFETDAWMARPTPLMAALLPALRAKGVLVVDALPALQAASDRALLLPNDTHLSDEGQRVVGEAVYRALSEAGAFSGGRIVDEASAAAARDPRVEALLQGSALEGASPDEKRLALKIAALGKLRAELQAILTSLPEQKAAAEKIQAEVVALEQGLTPEVVKRALDEAEARLRREGPPAGSLLARGPELEAELGRLLEKEPVAASDGETVKALKLELLREQRTTAALGKGASVAFRALRTVEQMKLALPRLRELRAASSH